MLTPIIAVVLLAKSFCNGQDLVSNDVLEAPATFPVNVSDVMFTKQYIKRAFYMTPDCSGIPREVHYNPMGTCVESGDANTVEMWGYIAKPANQFDFYIAGLQASCGSEIKYIYLSVPNAVMGKCVMTESTPSDDNPVTYYIAAFVPTIDTSAGGLLLSKYHSQGICQQKGTPDWTVLNPTGVCISLTVPFQGASSFVQTCSTGQDGAVSYTAPYKAYSNKDCTGNLITFPDTTTIYNSVCVSEEDTWPTYVTAQCLPNVATAAPNGKGNPKGKDVQGKGNPKGKDVQGKGAPKGKDVQKGKGGAGKKV